MAATTENDQIKRLNSRVDQQSTLIAMLKQRADKTQDEVCTTLIPTYLCLLLFVFTTYSIESMTDQILKIIKYTNLQLSESQQKYESSQKQVAKLQELLAEVTAEKTQLEDRFHTLAENHEQMIKIKDEYKEANCRLSSQQREETSTVKQLQDELKKIKSERDSFGKKCNLLEGRVSELERRTEADRKAHLAMVGELNSRHSNEVAILQRNVESKYIES